MQVCLSTIEETRVGFALCGPLQELFHRTAIECGVVVPDNVDSLIGTSKYAVDQILDACTRLSYTQPLDQVLRHIVPAVADEWSSQWRRIIITPQVGSQQQSSSRRYLQIDSLLNEE